MGAFCTLASPPSKHSVSLHAENTCVHLRRHLPGWGETQGQRVKLGEKSIFCDSRESTRAAALHTPAGALGALPSLLLSLLPHCSCPPFLGEVVQGLCWGSSAGGQLGFTPAKEFLFLPPPSILACPQAGTAGLFCFHKLHYVSHVLSGDVVPTWTPRREGAAFFCCWV